GPLGGLRRRQNRELGVFWLRGGGRAGAERDLALADAAVAQVLRMGVALAAITDDDHLLALHQVHVGITVIVNAHRSILSSRRARPAAERAVLERRRGHGNGAAACTPGDESARIEGRDPSHYSYTILLRPRLEDGLHAADVWETRLPRAPAPGGRGRDLRQPRHDGVAADGRPGRRDDAALRAGTAGKRCHGH